MKKTVLIADKNGQLGNQLYLFAHFISNAIENDYRLFFPAFNELSAYFENASRNQYGIYPISSRVSRFKFLNKCFLFLIRYVVAILFRTIPVTGWYRIIRLYHRNDLNEAKQDYYNIEEEPEFLSKQKLLLLQGWSFRSPKSVVRQREKIRTMFSLVPYWKGRVAEVIDECRKDCDILIGVHARRGDYKTFMKGIYYFDDRAYENFMLQLSRLFPGKRIKFLICSNEDVAPMAPEGCSIYFPKGHFIQDLYSLAECDYIIGPPSTFSQWASYYGNKPMKILLSRETPITSLNEFRVALL